MAHRIRLGTTDLQVSPVCYGSWQLSPRFWGDQPRDTLVTAIRRAFDVGVNFYDTADAYGDGYAETVLGEALATLPRDEIVIATKAYNHFFPDGRRFGDLSADYLPQACEASLRRMKIDVIDLYQCHMFDQLTPVAETAGALDDLVRKGWIRAYGVSNWSADQMRLGRSVGAFASCQPKYSLLHRESERDVLPCCQEHDMGVLVYSPLALGLLTGKFNGDEQFDDLRANHALYQGERFRDLCDRVRQAGEIAAKYDLTTVQLVLTVTLMHPAIHCAIVGIKNPSQIEEAAGAMGKTISREDWYAARQLLKP
ncbi:MAG: hypothetical protein CMJ18_01900 [Phycisphaeraceae bacterium]|nr:hypothetical protein [Phycisphaeraceae bacterium]